MVIMINGSFGVGKTTSAKLLRRALPGSIIYNPEWVGFVLRRLPKWARWRRSWPDDYQHLELWRWSVVTGVWLFGLLRRCPVIVPMAFSDRCYFDEVIAGISRFECDLRVFCLRASLATVKKRLIGRGDAVEGAGTEWIARRIVKCAEAHRDPHFGEPVETEGRTAEKVAEEIVRKIELSCSTA